MDMTMCPAALQDTAVGTVEDGDCSALTDSAAVEVPASAVDGGVVAVDVTVTVSVSVDGLTVDGVLLFVSAGVTDPDVVAAPLAELDAGDSEVPAGVSLHPAINTKMLTAANNRHFMDVARRMTIPPGTFRRPEYALGLSVPERT
ncbi:hypothetical protein [Nakamurella leprariae]|uniref:Uncharacterized protein n=1 Tax=Nakamurella leprariae TaxID=2803911 RepID=A0A938YHJ1_9ACTN|nr:hypothetical protein [Nakamurella leprariae]MBM9467943.1 hypothetical protein [Nakamurella leprariae]